MALTLPENTAQCRAVSRRLLTPLMRSTTGEFGVVDDDDVEEEDEDEEDEDDEERGAAEEEEGVAEG